MVLGISEDDIWRVGEKWDWMDERRLEAAEKRGSMYRRRWVAADMQSYGR